MATCSSRKIDCEFFNFSMGINLSVFSFVLFKNTGQAAPASIDFAYELAHTHQQSPFFNPGKPNSS